MCVQCIVHMKGILSLYVSLPPPVLPAIFLSSSILETHECIEVDDLVQFVISLVISSLSDSVWFLVKTSAL